MVAAAAKRRRLPPTPLRPMQGPRQVKWKRQSICYHYDDLCELLDDKCPFRNTAVFRDMPSDIQALATVKYPWNKTDDTPNFNGIPPHVLHLAKMESLERKMENLEANLMNKVTEEMESRGFSSTAFKTSDITAAIAGLVTELKPQISAELSQIKEAVNTHATSSNDYRVDIEAVVPLLTKTIGLVSTIKRKERLLKIQRNEDCNESGNNISCPPTS